MGFWHAQVFFAKRAARLAGMVSAHCSSLALLYSLMRKLDVS